jgi:hypothetical protein
MPLKYRYHYDYGRNPGGGGYYLEIRDGLTTIKTEYHNSLTHVRKRIRRLKRMDMSLSIRDRIESRS